jgi:hypothetical protein
MMGGGTRADQSAGTTWWGRGLGLLEHSRDNDEPVASTTSEHRRVGAAPFPVGAASSSDRGAQGSRCRACCPPVRNVNTHGQLS